MDRMILKVALGHTLREIRTEQSKTMREVSFEARIALGYLSEVERGEKEISSELLDCVLGSLGVSLSYVLLRTVDVLNFEQVTLDKMALTR